MTQKDLEEYKVSLKEKTYEELQNIEQDMIKEMDELDKKVSEMKFDLPKANYKEVATIIQKFLNTKQVTWQYAPALIALYEAWEPNEYKKKIEFPVLDTTLRTLGEFSFTGYTEWCQVVALNKYFEALSKEYTEVTQDIYDMGSKHSALVDIMQMKVPIGDVKKG